MKPFLVIALLMGTGTAQKAVAPKHLSEYMQKMALLYLDEAQAEQRSVASTLDNELQEKLLDEIENSIAISLQHAPESDEKAADSDYFLLLKQVRGLALGAGLEIHQGKARSGVKAWISCESLAMTQAKSGSIYEDADKQCMEDNSAYTKQVQADHDLEEKCQLLKKPKDRIKCKEGKIAPPA